MPEQRSRSSEPGDVKPMSMQVVRSPNNDKHTWDNCDDCPDMQRLLLKEQAVTDAGNYLLRLAPLINTALASNEVAEQQKGKTGLEELEDWVEEMREAEKKHHDFELLIGVAGSTGAGKTSLLNALLGIHEFLPSSCEQAATAVVCQVSWNHDMRPGFEYRAEVDFHSYEEIQSQVKGLFDAIASLQEIDDREYDDEDARIEDAAEAQGVINDVLGKVQAVWGPDISAESLQSMTTEDLIESNKDVLGLLGTTMQLHDSDPDKLSRQVRPYLDSTIHSHGREGTQFAAWPLVKHVRQFLRVDILKNGTSLVDLPGPGDMVESRAAVAQQFYEKLAVTIIVAPIIRAADEKTAHSLLGDYQELRLQMDGNYHRKGFGFVLTKTDDINIRGLLARSKEVQSQPEAMKARTEFTELDTAIKDLNAKLGIEEKILKVKQKQVKRAKAQMDKMVKRVQKAKPKNEDQLKKELKVLRVAKAEAVRASQEQRDKIMDLTEVKTAKTKTRAYMESKLAHLCTRTRNKFVQKRIQDDFRARQKKFRGSRKIRKRAALDSKIEVIPVSSVAFWRLRSDEAQLPGFPREAYTGIPRTKQWLWEATAESREQHLDTVLNSYAKLLNWIRQWSQDEDEEANIVFTKRDIEDALSPVHSKSLELLNLELSSFKAEIDEIDPLHNKAAVLKACATSVKKIIGRWHLTDPDNLACTTSMHWATHRAILTRRGASYTSRSSGIRYDWVQSLGNPLLQHLVQNWDQAMNQDLPAMLDPIMHRIQIAWHNYINDILYSLKGLSIDLATSVERSLQTFDPIMNVIRDEVRTALGTISQDAASTHPQLLTSILESMSPICQEALELIGPGCFKKRKRFIKDEGTSKGKETFRKALNMMDRKLKTSKERIPSTFDIISQNAVTAVKKHLLALLENILSGDTDDACARDKKIGVQAEARKLAVQWQVDWNSGKELQVDDAADMDIPEDFDAEDAVGQSDESLGDDEGTDGEAMDVDDEEQDSE
ncbi:hypothetical protein ACHAQH_009338 [Verticillium albo-atrum]